jgi:hypothetical protein
MKIKKHNTGQSLIEFAIVLPLMLLIIMGVFDLGRSIYYFSAIHNAAREGARYGAVNHCDTAGIKVAAQQMAIGLGDGVEVSDPIKFYTPEGNPDRILVSVEYEFEAVTPLIGVFLGEDGKVKLASEARQLIEISSACP